MKLYNIVLSVLVADSAIRGVHSYPDPTAEKIMMTTKNGPNSRIDYFDTENLDIRIGHSVEKKPCKIPTPLSKTNSHSCGDGLCLCNDSMAVCRSNQSLSYIPKLPPNITKLYFICNRLLFIHGSTFHNVSSLTHLYLGGNNLKYCYKDAFRRLTKLQSLRIIKEIIKPDTLRTCLASVTSRNFRKLVLYAVHINGTFSGSKIFSGMSNSPVEKIAMDRTYIDTYSIDDFSPLKHMRSLSLKSCWITATVFEGTSNLTTLWLTENALVKFPPFCNQTTFPNMKKLYMDGNFIRIFKANELDCMTSLELFSISFNPLLKLEANTFSGLPRLRTIYMRNNYGSSFRIKANAFNSSRLMNLHLGIYQIHAPHLSDFAFDSCKKLEKLDLSLSRFENKTDAYFDNLFAGLTNLKDLNLSGTGIGFLPTIIPRIMKQLDTLDVSHNQISWWATEYFRNLTFLRTLIMASNQIDTIHRFSFSFGTIQSLSHIDLSFNPYSCSCENLLWFSKLLKTQKATNKFINFPSGYLCSAPSAWEGERVIDKPISDRYCLLTPVISLIITSVSVGLLLLIFTLSMVYRHRWHLRYFVYMLRYYHIRFQRLVQDGCNYRYDIYLSCSEEDVDFILENILPRLENELNLRVFIPQRDGIGNKIDGIIENMDASRRVILCISDTFAADHYCEFETSIAYERVLNERRDLMIVILLEEVKVVNVTKTLHRVLAVDEYIPWDCSEQGVDMFWLTLIQHLESTDEPRP
ncbi:hypothetical protein SNE40_005361 [Patella caerulea]|uniref:TIR domain-containing protein n=1 Tax=Patella caerulea TaxID=87958 RepID=A0AAN8K2H4_PATCE